ncbi:MAG: MBL fold metallo-hydrolase [Propionibacteriaceae bacterium]|nr:MBL fold metallo-hydrolase [Propionibacteriaceae bacterium]
MLLRSAACGVLQNNCFILADKEGSECVIIDPGMDAVAAVRSLVAQHDLTPVAVLATHGHVDHIADAAPVADGYSIPVWIRSEDRRLLADAAAGMGPEDLDWLAMYVPEPLKDPARVELLDGVDRLDLANLAITVIHAPGHTPGSVLFRVDDPDTATTVVFTGDVLFAGSVGRTDLPGGDQTTMMATLRGPVLGLPDAARVLPGHGRSSTMSAERATNPYLQPFFLDR